MTTVPDTTPPAAPGRPLPVRASTSWARRTDGAVRVVLHLPEAEGLRGGEATLRLAGPRGRVRAPAEVRGDGAAGVLLEARVPARRLPPGVWRLAVRAGDGDVRRVQARLLTSRRQPVALLPGPTPQTVMAPPPPAPPSLRVRGAATARGLARRGRSALSALRDLRR